MNDPSANIDIQKIINRYKQYRNIPDEIAKIRLAYELADRQHEGHKRKSLHPYIIHPLAVAYLLADLELDYEVICAALLHDTIEDTDLQLNEITDKFGSGVASLVDALTKIRRESYATTKEDDQINEIESIRKIIIGATQDVRVILIKLADRWDNVRSLKALPPVRGKKFAQETLSIFAPFAERLGLSIMREEMENLCFQYLHPKKYAKSLKRILSIKSFIQSDVLDLKQQISGCLNETGIPNQAYEEFQTPHGFFFRSMQKLRPTPVDLTIITETTQQCYRALGEIHRNFKPMSDTSIKDYIAIPRSNGYQALHTTLIFRENIFPIIIHTAEMNRIANYGVLANIRGRHDSGFQTWINTLKEIVTEANSSVFIKSVQEASAEDKIYVCTPQGDFVGFPPNAIILDFAYRIHTDIGHHCASAFMNNEPVGIHEELRDGAMIEIIKSPDVHPQVEWLNKVKTPRAKTAIRDWLDNQKRQMSLQFGKKILTHEMRRYNLNLEELLVSANFLQTISQLNVDSIDDLFTKLGRGILTTRRVISLFVTHADFKKSLARQGAILPRLLPFLFSQNKNEDPYLITDIHDAFIKLSKCCNPLPGDEVIGILTIHHGLSVHRVDCKAMKFRSDDKDRIIKIGWQFDSQMKQITRILIRTDNRQDIPEKIFKALNVKKIPIFKFNAEKLANEINIEVEIEATSAEQAQLIIQLISRVKGVQKAQRQ